MDGPATGSLSTTQEGESWLQLESFPTRSRVGARPPATITGVGDGHCSPANLTCGAAVKLTMVDPLGATLVQGLEIRLGGDISGYSEG